MPKVTCSLAHWMLANGHQKELVLLKFGHGEVLTDEMYKEYIAWVKTDEGRTYLEGGRNYHEPM